MAKYTPNRSPASSGSRMLSAFYSRLLEENDDCAYYFDSSGKRLKEANFYRVELFDDYFMRWERSQKKCNEPAPSPIKSLEMECFSTSSTVASECDCWASTDSLFPWVQQVPVLRRCSSLQSVVTKVEMHRTNTGPYLQKATYNAIAQQSQSTPILGLAVTAS